MCSRDRTDGDKDMLLMLGRTQLNTIAAQGEGIVSRGSAGSCISYTLTFPNKKKREERRSVGRVASSCRSRRRQRKSK